MAPNKFKFLVVDDNQPIRFSLINLLKEIFFSYDKSFDIIEAMDGIDILKIIMEDQKNGNLIKCIFTDESMEYLDGSQAIEMIRKMENRNRITRCNIVTVSSFEDEFNKREILAKGADYFIEKPCRKCDLINILSELELI